MERREKKQQRCQAHEAARAGDLWDHTAVTADRKLVVRLVVGKRTQGQTNALVHDAQRRLRDSWSKRVKNAKVVFLIGERGYLGILQIEYGYEAFSISFYNININNILQEFYLFGSFAPGTRLSATTPETI